MQTLPTFSGELSRGWSLFAGYTFNRNTYKRDINNQGLDFNTYTPKHMLRLWSAYQPPGAWACRLEQLCALPDQQAVAGLVELQQYVQQALLHLDRQPGQQQPLWRSAQCDADAARHILNAADVKKAALQRPLPFAGAGADYMPRAQKMATTAITGTTWPCHITHLRVCLISSGAGS